MTANNRPTPPEGIEDSSQTQDSSAHPAGSQVPPPAPGYPFNDEPSYGEDVPRHQPPYEGAGQQSFEGTSYQEPAYGTTYQPVGQGQPRKNNTAKIVIIVIVAVLLLCCCLPVAAGTIFMRSPLGQEMLQDISSQNSNGYFEEFIEQYEDEFGDDGFYFNQGNPYQEDEGLHDDPDSGDASAEAYDITVTVDYGLYDIWSTHDGTESEMALDMNSGDPAVKEAAVRRLQESANEAIRQLDSFEFPSTGSPEIDSSLNEAVGDYERAYQTHIEAAEAHLQGDSELMAQKYDEYLDWLDSADDKIEDAYELMESIPAG